MKGVEEKRTVGIQLSGSAESVEKVLDRLADIREIEVLPFRPDGGWSSSDWPLWWYGYGGPAYAYGNPCQGNSSSNRWGGRYCSIFGGMTLLSYAIYRADPVFIVGQAGGLIIYTRNLYFIYRERTRLPEASAS